MVYYPSTIIVGHKKSTNKLISYLILIVLWHLLRVEARPNYPGPLHRTMMVLSNSKINNNNKHTWMNHLKEEPPQAYSPKISHLWPSLNDLLTINDSDDIHHNTSIAYEQFSKRLQDLTVSPDYSIADQAAYKKKRSKKSEDNELTPYMYPCYFKICIMGLKDVSKKDELEKQGRIYKKY